MDVSVSLHYLLTGCVWMIFIFQAMLSALYYKYFQKNILYLSIALAFFSLFFCDALCNVYKICYTQDFFVVYFFCANLLVSIIILFSFNIRKKRFYLCYYFFIFSVTAFIYGKIVNFSIYLFLLAISIFLNVLAIIFLFSRKSNNYLLLSIHIYYLGLSIKYWIYCFASNAEQSLLNIVDISYCFTAIALIVLVQVDILRVYFKEQNKHLLIERTMQDLLATLTRVFSHNLKEPVRAIYNHICFLLEDYNDIDQKSQERISRIITLTKHIEILMNNIFYFLRIHEKTVVLDKVDMQKLVENIIENEFVDHRDAIVLENNLPVVIGNKGLLKQVFYHLINNGIQFNTKAKKCIAIKCCEQKDKYIFSVTDNGIGIDEQFHAKIFDLFQQLHSKKVYSDGTGVGLALVKKIIELHGGIIWLESQKSGTTFYFSLERDKYENRC